MILEMVQAFTVTRFGTEAAFSPTELMLIQPSLTRIIERYGSAANQFSWLVDPALVIAGGIIYAGRLASMIRKPSEPPDDSGSGNPPQSPAEPDDPSGNGARGLTTEQLFSMTGDLSRL